MQAPGAGVNICWKSAVKYFASGSADRELRRCMSSMLQYLWVH